MDDKRNIIFLLILSNMLLQFIICYRFTLPDNLCTYSLKFFEKFLFNFSRFTDFFHADKISPFYVSISSSLSYFFSCSLRIVPIFLSDLVSLPLLFRIVPGGSPCFCSKVPTVQSLLVFLVFLLPIILSLYFVKFRPKSQTVKCSF